MSLFAFNTLTRQREALAPVDSKAIGLYVCGPTVYGDPHLGHARSAVVFDVVVRYLEALGHRVFYVRNITDIDDKIIARARHLNRDYRLVAARCANRYREAMARLNVSAPHMEPRASAFIGPIQDFILKLIQGGHAYAAPDGVYFDTSSFPAYGRLSGRTLSGPMATDEGRPAEGKRHPADFALWKSAKPDEPWWPSPWGRGRPGWHIECSAMSASLLGEVYDIHGGGSDLIFPHHENEVAQSASLSGKVPATFWLHNGMVTVRGQKMAKSAGNGLDLRDLFERYPPEAIRLWLLSKRYRHPIEFSHAALEGAHASWRRLQRFFSAESFKSRIPSPAAHRRSPCWRRFCDAMDDDFNFPKALSIVFEGIRHLNRQTAASPGGPAPVDQETAGYIFRDLYGMCRHVLGFRLDPRGPSPEAATSNLQ